MDRFYDLGVESYRPRTGLAQEFIMMTGVKLQNTKIKVIDISAGAILRFMFRV